MRIGLIDTDSVWAWGSRMISAILKQQGHDTRILIMATEDRRYSPEQLLELKALLEDCSVIGISCCSRGSDRAHQVLKYLEPCGKFRVWGGVHATLNPDECLRSADAVCIGEGEGLIVDLISRLEQGLDWRDVPNVAYISGSETVRNPLRPLIKNMDDLPLLDFSCTSEFHLTGDKFVRRTLLSDLAQEGVPFLASRGCVFHCTYCCNSKLRQTYAGTGHYVRKHSIGESVRRAATLHQQSFRKSKYVFFVDDDFLDRTPAELRQFAEEYPAKVGLPFECQVSPLRVTEERIEQLVKAGVWRIRMGVESGSERTKRQIYQRAMPNDSVMRASEILSRHPEVVRAYYFIIGNPFEEREDLLATINLIARLPRPFFVQPFNLIFFPGSVLYDRAIEAGLINGKGDSGYELHYRKGLRYSSHSWKQKNLYLNTLLFLMDGKVTRTRLGVIPRFLLRWLIHPRFVAFNERYLTVAKAMIVAKMFTLSLRTMVGSTVKRVLPHPEALYNPVAFLKAKAQLWSRVVFNRSAA
jgi:anaerobic magnesium-protoporphyrin IX monomethyl ester cyclase